MQGERIKVGVITGAHGVRGEVRVRPLTDTPEGLVAYGPVLTTDGRAFDLTLIRVTQRGVICRVKAVNDRNAAEALIGAELTVAADRLPAPAADEWYVDDLIGLTATDPAGQAVGVVRAVQDYGAGDVVELLTSDGRELVLPFTEAVFPEVAPADGKLVVVIPEFLGEPEATEQGTELAG